MPEDNQGYILVVDDNEMNRDMLSRRLQRQGYSIAVAENGVRAIEMMNDDNFDLVLLDIMMPKLNGYEVLERVKNDPNLSHIPIIMISAVDDLDSVVKCIELGAEDYLFKPFNPVLLKARVRAGLDKKRASERDAGNESASGDVLQTVNDVLQNLSLIEQDSAGALTDNQSMLLREAITGIENIKSKIT